MATSVTEDATEGQVLTKRSGAAKWDTPGATSTRQVQLVASLGLMSENFARSVGSTNTALVSGTIYLMAIGALGGDVLTNGHPCIGTGGSGLTLCKVGLYDKAGNRLTMSADVSSDWASTGPRTNPFASPYTMPADGAVYLALLAVGTTPPTMLRASNLSNVATAIGTNFRPVATGGTAQTDLPSTIAVVAGTPIAYWGGIS